MSDTRKRISKSIEYDRAIPKEEYIEDILNLVRLPCGFCGSTQWEMANYSIDFAKIDACSDCHILDDRDEFVRRTDA